MYCGNCGERIPESSKFCLNCGAVINAYETEPLQATSKQQMPELEAEEKDRSGLKLLLILGIPISIFIFLGVLVNIDFEEAEVVGTQSSISVPASTISSEYEALSAREIQIRKIFSMGAQGNIEGCIKKLLKNSNTAHFEHDKSSWSANNAILTGGGSVTYTNASNSTVTESFDVSIIMTDKYYFSLYVKLGDTVSENVLSGVNSLGLATRSGASIFGVNQSSSIFGEEAANIVFFTDEASQKITLDEFNRIKTGMRYEEVTEIIGSFGTELARSEISGYQTVIIAWDGIGELGANANVTFSNGQVSIKAQFGLR